MKFRSNIALFLWVLLWSAPYFLYPPLFAYVEWLPNLNGTRTVRDLYLAQLFWIVISGVGFSFLLSFLRMINAGRLGVLIRATGIILFFIYNLLMASAWGVFFEISAFPHLKDLVLFSFLSDSHVLSTSASSVDLLLIPAVISIAIAATVLLWMASPPTFMRLRMAVLAPAVAIFIWLLYPTITIRDQISDARSLAKNFISPEFSFFLANFLFPSEDRHALDVKTLKQEDLIPLSAPTSTSLLRTDIKVSKNILIIVVEGLRYDLLEPRYKNIMPTLHRLKNEGIDFSRAYAQASDTGYSLTTILTGLYPLRYEYRDIYTHLNYPYTPIFEPFRKLGFSTGLFHAEWPAMKRVFLSYPADIMVDSLTVDKSILEKLIQETPLLAGESVNSPIVADYHSVEKFKEWTSSVRGGNRHFFASLYLFGSHFPYHIPHSAPHIFKEGELKEAASFFGYPEEFVPEMKNRYFNSLHYVDSTINELLKHLEEDSALKDTILVVTGDHGQMFHEHGAVGHAKYLYEEAIRVPLIFWGLPPSVRARSLDEPVGHIDIAPTLLEIAGIPFGPEFQGCSILCNGSCSPPLGRRNLFITSQLWTEEHAIIEWPWKLILSERGRPPQLFNLLEDMHEKANVFQEQPQLAHELTAKLQTYRSYQIQYYNPTGKFVSNYFPPKYDACDEVSK